MGKCLMMINCGVFFIVALLFTFFHSSAVSFCSHVTPQEFTIDNINDFACEWIFDRACPDTEAIRFYLYTRKNINESQFIHIDDTFETSNLSQSNFNPQHQTKVIIHGFRSDMFLTPLYEMKDGKAKLIKID